jgi:hypothetical protein
MKNHLSKLALLALLITQPARAEPEPAPPNWQSVNGQISNINAPGSKWTKVEGTVVGLHTNGSIVQLQAIREVFNRPPPTTVRAKVYGRAPAGSVNYVKVPGRSIFLFGHKLLLGEDVHVTALPIGQATVNGAVMEVWKTGTPITAKQLRDFQDKVRAEQLRNQTTK